MLTRILVATDRSETAGQAVTRAGDVAERFDAELVVVQVVAPGGHAGSDTAGDGAGDGTVGPDRLRAETEALRQHAQQLVSVRFRPVVVVDENPADAIVAVAEREDVDLVVVGNVGMRGRTEFLLGNVPNRVSHKARCSVMIVNSNGSAQVSDDPRHGRRDGRDEPRLVSRAGHIAAVMAKFGVRHLFASRRDDEEATRAEARRLRAALEELGPTFAKLGQILSTRPDLLPAAFVEELAGLQDQVTPMTESEVVSMMEQELGVPWEDVFETLDPTPLAAGTIAQVHRATLAGGERVVVKVQRPTAERDILDDLALLERFAEKTAGRPVFRQVVDLPAIIQHLSASLRRELDFRQEAANVERLHDVLAPFSRLDVPDVYRDLCTGRLLVMEEIRGVPIRQAPPSDARQEAARQLLESFYLQILSDGFFHADPHPGNLLWWKDTIYFLDCGMVGELDADVREILTLLLMACWQQDAAFLSEVLLMLAGDEQRTDVDFVAFTADLERLLERYRDSSLQDIQLGPVLQEITEISLRHDVRLPSALTLTAKALAQMQLATAELDPSLDPFSVAGSFMARNIMGRIRGGLDPKRLFYDAQRIKVRVVRLIESVERLSGARPGPKLQVQFRGTERLEEGIQRAARHMAVALTASGALVGAAITANSARVERWVPVVLGGTGGVLTTGLVADLLRPRLRPRLGR
ncbi:MAG: AarF/UbiB family protein [Actinomycetota bacterium]|nr:AarF/UbiB family protein [Actinomycetota bacterium]